MKKLKRWLSGLMVCAMLLTMLPVPAMAADTLASGTCGDNLTWTLTDDGILTVSGTGAMENYTSSAFAPWYTYRMGVTSVVVEEGVTSIGAYAFYNCTVLTDVAIPDSVESIDTAGFSGCTVLPHITIPVSVTSIGNSAFNNCTKLATVYYGGSKEDWSAITIGSGNTKLTGALISYNGLYDAGTCGDELIWTLTEDNVLTISGQGNMTSYTSYSAVPWYKYRTNIAELVLEDGITSIGDYAFYGCTKLTNVTIPEGVTSIGSSAFYNCTSLTGVSIPEGVASIGSSAFYNCSKLTGVSIPEGVTSIGSSAFYNCARLTNAVIPESVTSIGDSAFSGCTSLTTAVIPDGITTIATKVFYNCTALASVTIPSSVLSIMSSAFGNCTGLTQVYYGGIQIQWDGITIASGNTPLTSAFIAYGGSNMISGTCGDSLTWTLTSDGVLTISGEGAVPDYSSASGAPWYKWKASITSLVVQEGVTSIGNHSFNGYTELTHVTLLGGLTSIGNNAFRGCTGLTDVTIPEGVSTIGSFAFYSCTSLTTVTILAGVTSIGNSVFSGCTSLTGIAIPDSVTSIGDYVFNNCDNLSTFYYSGNKSQWYRLAFEVPGMMIYFNSTGPENADDSNAGSYAGYGVTGNLTWAVESNGTLTISGQGAMENYTSSTAPWEKYRSSITSVVVEDGVTSIGDYALYNCTGLTEASIPDSITSIGTFAFNGCAGLTEITIPDSVTSIGFSAFSGCTSLTEITIPDGVTSINSLAFSGCTGLTSIAVPGSVTSIGFSVFSGCTGLTQAVIGSGVTSIGSSMFSDCTGLTNIIIPESVASIGGAAFSNCPNLAAIYYGGSKNQWYHIEPSLTGTTVYFNSTGPEDADDSDSSIGSYIAHGTTGDLIWELGADGTLTISGTGTMPDYSSYVPWYSYRSSITNVFISDGVQSIGNSAFHYCSYLTEVTISDSVTSIGDSAFADCTSLTSIVIPGSVTSIGSTAFYCCSGLTEIAIPAGITTIESGVFFHCTGLTSITIPDGVTSIEDAAFSGCTGLTVITIPASVTSIGYQTFYAGTPPYNLKKVYYSGSEAQWAAISIGSSNTPLTNAAIYYDGLDYLHGSCGEHVNWTLIDGVLTISGTGDMANYTSDSPAAWYKYRSSITSLVIADGVTSIGDYAFYYCTGLAEVTIPDGVTSIGEGAFYYCTGLAEVTIPDSVTSIGDYAFYYCTGLAEVTIPDGVTSIGGGAFFVCSSLTQVTIGSGIAAIGYRAFWNCNNLSTVTVKNPVAPALGGTGVFLPATTVVAPAASVGYRIGDWAGYNVKGPTAGTNGFGVYLDGAEYDAGDVETIHTLIREKGLDLEPMSPVSWTGFVIWNVFASPRTIEAIDLTNEAAANLTGRVSLTGTTGLQIVTDLAQSGRGLDLTGCTGLKMVICSDLVTVVGADSAARLTISTSGSGAVDLTKAQLDAQANQLRVSLTAVPDTGYEFKYWDRDGVQTTDTLLETTYSLKTGARYSLTAAFSAYAVGQSIWPIFSSNGGGTSGNIYVTPETSASPSRSFDAGDIAVINAIIRNNGLTSCNGRMIFASDPIGWEACGLVTWTSYDNIAKVRILRLPSTVYGNINLSRLSQLLIVNGGGSRVTGLDLSDCYNLQAVARDSTGAYLYTSFDKMANLEYLDLSNCVNLLEVDYSYLTPSLKGLNVSGCFRLNYMKLTGLANLKHLFANSTALTSLDLTSQQNLSVLTYDKGTKLTNLPAGVSAVAVETTGEGSVVVALVRAAADDGVSLTLQPWCGFRSGRYQEWRKTAGGTVGSMPSGSLYGPLLNLTVEEGARPEIHCVFSGAGSPANITVTQTGSSIQVSSVPENMNVIVAAYSGERMVFRDVRINADSSFTATLPTGVTADTVKVFVTYSDWSPAIPVKSFSIS